MAYIAASMGRKGKTTKQRNQPVWGWVDGKIVSLEKVDSTQLNIKV